MTDTEQLKRSGGVAVTDLRVTFEAGVAVEVEASGQKVGTGGRTLVSGAGFRYLWCLDPQHRLRSE